MKRYALVTAVALFVLAAFAGAALACEGGSSCPMQVKGAKIEVKKTDKGAVITITATDPNAIKEVQARAEKIQKDGGCACMKAAKEGEKKDEKGCSCGGEGKCPHAKQGGSCGGDKKEESKCPYAN